MASSTITRPTLTDDSGTPAAPVGDGDLVDAAFIADLLNRIDDLFSRAETIVQIMSAEGFGTHDFTGSGTGINEIEMRNAASGATNLARIALGNNAAALAGALEAFSSAFTTANLRTANGITLRALLAGGLALVAEAGTLVLAANGTTETVTWNGEDLEAVGANRGACHVPMVLDGSVASADDGNAADTSFHTIYEDVIPADTLDEDGRTLRYTCIIAFTSGNTKTLRVTYGDGTSQTTIDSGSNTSTVNTVLTILITRTGSNAQRVSAIWGSAGANEGATVDTTVADTAATTIRVEGQSAASAANDVVFKHGYGEVVR